jgi:hypothetical protein
MDKSRRQLTACFDFDGVISEYQGWKGVDAFGEPIQGTIDTMKKLKKEGWFVTIFTTRKATPLLIEWLDKNKVPYDSINSTAHNPPNTSNKPLFDIVIDDRAVSFTGQSGSALYNDIHNLLKFNRRRTGEDE